VFSRDPAQRMVIVNGQVWGQGSEPAAGVVVEEIRPNAAVVRFKGQQYTLPF
jgi:general secretion pathway protein B